MSEIVLGARYRDQVTGFEGVAFGHCVYLSGCNQTLLVPTVDEKGAFREGHWFDDQRLAATSDLGVLVLDNAATPGCDIPAPKR